MRRRPRRSLIVVLLVSGLLASPMAPATGAIPPEAMLQCQRHPDMLVSPEASAPAELLDVIEEHLEDDRLDDSGLALVVWIEGYTEVVEQLPDLRLRPASNQKLLTAMSAFEHLGPDYRFTTTVATDGLLADGVLDGNLYLIGGGDATLASEDVHSLQTLADALVAGGVTDITGSVVGDESRYDTMREANGWLPLNIPESTGSLSALSVDENRWRADWPFIADPTLANAQLFADTLATAGISSAGEPAAGEAPANVVAIATLESAPVSELMGIMLTESNNMIAELTTKEIGLAMNGVGSTTAGMRAAAEVVAELCVRRSTLQHDGSGLSHANARSARSWVELLQSAQSRPWWEHLYNGLPVAGVSGTLERRFVDTAAEDNLRAKTGTINEIRALSGLLTTAGDRRVFFSAIVDAPNPRPGMSLVDDLLAAIAEDES